MNKAKSTISTASEPMAALTGDIRRLIAEVRIQVAIAANATLTMLYWHIGQRIHGEVLKGERAGCDDQIVLTLSRQLEAEYGRGFNSNNLHHMLRFAEVFRDEEIVYALSRQLSLIHLHMALSMATGEVVGGHVAKGCIVRTTAEVLLALLPEWEFAREPDVLTGYDELVVRPRSDAA